MQIASATMDTLAARLRDEAVSTRGVPEDLAVYAERAALDRFGDGAGRAEVDPRRVADYFWGVVRRRAFTTHREAAGRLRARLLLQSVVDDLRETGRSDERIYEEIAAHYSHALGGGLLEDLRGVLCVASRSAERGRGHDVAALAV